MITGLGAVILRKHLDDVPLWSGNHVAVRQRVDFFGRYLYLPRLAGPEVLVNAIREDLALLTWQVDTFAYADSFDEAAGRYRGLRGGQQVAVSQDSAGLLVKPDVARRQLEAEVPARGTTPGTSELGVGPGPKPGATEPRSHGAHRNGKARNHQITRTGY